MAAVKMDLKTAKLCLKVSKAGLTKAISEYERAGEQFEKNKDAAVARSRRVRLAATLIEALDTINLKVKKMKESKDTCIEVIIGIDDDDLSKLKDEHINEIELDYDKYIKNIRDLENSSEELVSKAEEFLQGPQVDYTTQPVSAAAGTVAEMFKPQSNRNPSFLDKMASHLEVHKFVQGAEVYIQTGFRETPPQGIWAYLRPLVHVTWSNALDRAGNSGGTREPSSQKEFGFAESFFDFEVFTELNSKKCL